MILFTFYRLFLDYGATRWNLAAARASGSHHIYMLPDRSKRVIVPLHNKDLPKGTLISILKQAGIDKSEL